MSLVARTILTYTGNKSSKSKEHNPLNIAKRTKHNPPTKCSRWVMFCMLYNTFHAVSSANKLHTTNRSDVWHQLLKTLIQLCISWTNKKCMDVKTHFRQAVNMWFQSPLQAAFCHHKRVWPHYHTWWHQQLHRQGLVGLKRSVTEYEMCHTKAQSILWIW